MASFPDSIRRMIYEQVRKDRNKYSNFKGFVKVTYITASPKSIKSVEPINGTVKDYFETYKKEKSIDFNVF